MQNRLGRSFQRRLQIPTWLERASSDDPYAAYLVYASFIGADGLAVESYIPEKDSVGSGFDVLAGTAAQFKLSSNRLWINLNSGTWSIAIIDAGEADVVITGTLILGGNNPFVAVRVSDANNFIVCNFSVSADVIRIQKVQAGGWSTLAFTAQAYASGDVVSFQITLLGNDITVEDLTRSKNASTSNSFNNTATKHGVGENTGNNAVYLDNFSIA